jgi:hypothetical protein
LKARPVIRLAVIGVLACAGVLGASAPAAFAGASTFPAAGLKIDVGSVPPPGKGVSVVGDCPGYLFTDDMAFKFTSGSAVGYGPASNPLTFGGNAQGDAFLFDRTTASPTGYAGHLHVWFGVNVNPTGNLQNYNGETVSFNGSGPAGSITINASFGGGQSASGNPTGWAHVKVTCS